MNGEAIHRCTVNTYITVQILLTMSCRKDQQAKYNTPNLTRRRLHIHTYTNQRRRLRTPSHQLTQTPPSQPAYSSRRPPHTCTHSAQPQQPCPQRPPRPTSRCCTHPGRGRPHVPSVRGPCLRRCQCWSSTVRSPTRHLHNRQTRFEISTQP